MPGFVTIYGASDDLIEVEGAIVEEFYAFTDMGVDADRVGGLLVFSCGTVLEVIYDHNGVWRIAQVEQGRASFEKLEAPIDDEDNYSDRVTLIPAAGEPPITWVVYGKQVAPAREYTATA